jgi:hypothetical protein
MTPDETVVLARYVRALCPQQKFDEYTPDAWHDVLGDYPLAAARRAAATVARRQPFISPAEIIEVIEQQRAEAASDFQGPGLPAEVPDADPDDVPAYLAALRAQRYRAADGYELKPRPMRALLGRVGATIPAQPAAEVAAVRRPGPLGIVCPKCKAAIGKPCKMPGSSERYPLGQPMRDPHAIRVAVATGQPLPATHDPLAEAAAKEASRLALEQLSQEEAS